MKNTYDIIMKFSERVKDIFDINLSKIILYGSYARGGSAKWMIGRKL